MKLTSKQVLSLAPDERSIKAARKLATPRHWTNLGHDEDAIWGECQGSALYQTRIDLSDLASKCSCPSRKFPCKHSLGLLLIASENASAISDAEPPDWVTEWIDRRKAAAKRKVDKAADNKKKPVDPKAQARRQKQREKRVALGIDQLDRWMADLVHNGLAAVEVEPPSFWNDQSRRLIDAQAPGLASLVRRMGEEIGTSPDWPKRLLEHLGRLALLTHAYKKLDQLDAALSSDIKQMIGFSIKSEEVLTDGERLLDRWMVVGQRHLDEDRLRIQRNWLIGEKSKRLALFLQFSTGGVPFSESMIASTCFKAELAFFPSAFPMRVLIAKRIGDAEPISHHFPGCADIDIFLNQLSEAISHQPWITQFPCVLCGVIPSVSDFNGGGHFVLIDRKGASLPFNASDPYLLIALSGGSPIDVAGEWDGEQVCVLGAFAGDRFHTIMETIHE